MAQKANSELIQRGLLQAIGVAVYCAAVAFFMFNVEHLFGGEDTSFFAPAAFLLLFIVSGLTCASIVFYKPYRLFIEGKRNDAVELVVYTTVFLAIFFFTFLTIGIISQN